MTPKADNNFTSYLEIKPKAKTFGSIMADIGSEENIIKDVISEVQYAGSLGSKQISSTPVEGLAVPSG
jgi:hypothetical protein